LLRGHELNGGVAVCQRRPAMYSDTALIS